MFTAKCQIAWFVVDYDTNKTLSDLFRILFAPIGLNADEIIVDFQ